MTIIEAAKALADEKLGDNPFVGREHSERVRNLTHAIAAAEGFQIEAEPVEIAALLHDVAFFDPHPPEEKDHNDECQRVTAAFLEEQQYDSRKAAKVMNILAVLNPSKPEPECDEARAFKDADAIDFLGICGVARHCSFAGINRFSLAKALNNCEALMNSVGPEICITETGKHMLQESMDSAREILRIFRKEIH